MSIWTWLIALALIVLPSPAFAQDDDATAAPPPDAPMVNLPADVVVPPLPADFSKRDLGWLQISYPSSVEERIAPLIKDAEEVKAALGRELGQPVLGHVEVRVGRSPEQMKDLSPVGLPPPKYAVGVAYPPLHLVALSLLAPETSEAPDLDEVFRHELSHVALEDAVLGHHVPRWFNEGLAMYESGERIMARTKTLADASLSRSLLPLADLDRRFPNDSYQVNIAYAESGDFVRFLFRHADHERAMSLVRRVREGQSFDRALTDAYGADTRRLEYEWKQELDKRFTIWPVLTGGGLIWVLTIAAAIGAYVTRRRKTKATLARWEREEAEAAERQAKLERLLLLRDAEVALPGPQTSIEPSESRPEPSSLPPMVEHDGSWHVLH